MQVEYLVMAITEEFPKPVTKAIGGYAKRVAEKFAALYPDLAAVADVCWIANRKRDLEKSGECLQKVGEMILMCITAPALQLKCDVLLAPNTGKLRLPKKQPAAGAQNKKKAPRPVRMPSASAAAAIAHGMPPADADAQTVLAYLPHAELGLFQPFDPADKARTLATFKPSYNKGVAEELTGRCTQWRRQFETAANKEGNAPALKAVKHIQAQLRSARSAAQNPQHAV